MRIRMTKTRNWTVPSDRRVTIQYKEGKRYTVKRAWGEQLVAAGEAEEIEAGARSTDETPPARKAGSRTRGQAAG